MKTVPNLLFDPGMYWKFRLFKPSTQNRGQNQINILNKNKRNGETFANPRFDHWQFWLPAVVSVCRLNRRCINLAFRGYPRVEIIADEALGIDALYGGQRIMFSGTSSGELHFSPSPPVTGGLSPCQMKSYSKKIQSKSFEVILSSYGWYFSCFCFHFGEQSFLVMHIDRIGGFSASHTVLFCARF